MLEPQQQEDPLAGLDSFTVTGRDANKAYARTQAQKRNLDPDFVDRIFTRESGYNPSARSSQSAVGIAQLTPGTQKRFGVKNPYDAKESIDAGLTYMEKLRDQFKGDQRRMAAGYFSGEGAAERALANPAGNPKTAAYAGAVGGDALSGLDDYLVDGSGTPSAATPQPATPKPSFKFRPEIEDTFNAARSTGDKAKMAEVGKELAGHGYEVGEGDGGWTYFKRPSDFHPGAAAGKPGQFQRISQLRSFQRTGTQFPSVQEYQEQVAGTPEATRIAQDAASERPFVSKRRPSSYEDEDLTVTGKLGGSNKTISTADQEKIASVKQQEAAERSQQQQADYLRSLPPDQRRAKAIEIAAREPLGDEARQLAGFGERSGAEQVLRDVAMPGFGNLIPGSAEQAFQSTAGPLIGTAAETLSGIGEKAEQIAPYIGYGDDYHSPLKKIGGDLNAAATHMRNMAPHNAAAEFAGGLAGTLPLLVLPEGLAGMAVQSYLGSIGRGEDESTALKHAAVMVAGLKAGGVVGQTLERQVQGTITRYLARATGAATGLEAMSIGTGEPQTPGAIAQRIGMGAVFGVHGGQPDSEASRRAPGSVPATAGARDVSQGQSPSELVPEPKGSIPAQLQSLRNQLGSRRAVLVPTDGEMPVSRSQLENEGFAVTKTPVGTFIHDVDPRNPRSVSRKAVRQMAGDGTYHELLGIVEPKSPAATEAVVARDKSGNEIQAAMASPDNVPAQAAEFAAQHPQARVGVERPEEVIAGRVAANPQQDVPNNRTFSEAKAAEVSQESKVEPAKQADKKESPILDRVMPNWGVTLREFANGQLPGLTKIAQESPTWREFATEMDRFLRANPGVRGKTVPSEVLADYPELQSKTEAPPLTSGENLAAALKAKRDARGARVAELKAKQTEKSSTVDIAAHDAATSPTNDTPKPTDAQIEAGNYKLGHTKIGGLDVSIENPEGTKRKPEWPALKSHYGYIRATEGADGEHIDTFVKPGTPEDYSGPVFVVDQTKKGGGFDEHKVMLGWSDEASAKAGYLKNYTKGWKAGPIREFENVGAFRDWLKTADTTKPAAAPTPEERVAIQTRLSQMNAKEGGDFDVAMKEIRAAQARRDDAALQQHYATFDKLQAEEAALKERLAPIQADPIAKSSESVTPESSTNSNLDAKPEGYTFSSTQVNPARLNERILARVQNFKEGDNSQVGAVGGLLLDPHEAKQFRSIASVPIIVDPGLSRPAETRFPQLTEAQMKAGVPRAEIRVRPDATEEILYHEMVHADRGAKGRTITPDAQWPHPEEHRALMAGKFFAERAKSSSMEVPAEPEPGLHHSNYQSRDAGRFDGEPEYPKEDVRSAALRRGSEESQHPSPESPSNQPPLQVDSAREIDWKSEAANLHPNVRSDATRIGRMFAEPEKNQRWLTISDRLASGDFSDETVRQFETASRQGGLSPNTIKAIIDHARGNVSTDESSATGTQTSESPEQRTGQDSSSETGQLSGNVKERSLPKTLDAAEIDSGTNRTYQPTTILAGSDEGRRIVREKGIDGAIEHVLHGDAGIEWASTGYAAMEEMRAEEARLRPADPAAADAVAAKRLKFVDDFAEAATKHGQAIAGVRAIEEFAPDRFVYQANKLSQKNLKHGLSPREEARNVSMGEKLQAAGNQIKQLEATLEAQAATKTRSKKEAKKARYQAKLEERGASAKQALAGRAGSLDLGMPYQRPEHRGERGFVRIGRDKRAKQADTPEFKKWFGDSKVVDEKGKPLVVYHGTGTPVDFDAFSKEKAGTAYNHPTARMGFWFTTSADTASEYASKSEAGAPYPRVMPVFLRVAKPKVMDAAEFEERFVERGTSERKRIAEIKEELKQLSAKSASDLEVIRQRVQLESESQSLFVKELLASNKRLDSPTSYVKRLQKSGYDGLAVQLSDQTAYVTFEPTQIKSAIGNRGTFNPNDPNIGGFVRFGEPPLHGDAELIAQYAASRLTKLGSAAALNAELIKEFGPEIESHLGDVRRRAYAIRQEARLAEIAGSTPERRKTILQDIQKEIQERQQQARDAGRVERIQTGLAKKGEAEANLERQARERKTERQRKAWDKEEAAAERERAIAVAREREARANQSASEETRAKTSRERAEANLRTLRDGRLAQEQRDQAREAERLKREEAIYTSRLEAEAIRERLTQVRRESVEAGKAEKAAYHADVRANRDAERKAALWDTPLRDQADEARTRLSGADPKAPETTADLVSVATEMLLPRKPGGSSPGKFDPNQRFQNALQFYADLKAQFPNLVTRKNQGEIYKQAYQRVQDMTKAAREAARLKSASTEERRLWNEMGIDTDAQALLIQRAEAQRQQLEARSAMAGEFNRVSRSRLRRVAFELQSLPRALQSSIDAPIGRQGLFYLVTHPIETARFTIPATAKGYTALRRGDYHQLVADMQKHPDYRLGWKAGLDLPGIASEVDPRVSAEESFQSTWAERLPHVRLSEQGFTHGMNAQRLAAFSRYADLGRAQGYTWESNPDFFKQAAEYVNVATGRGNMPEALKRATAMTNALFYSTRLQVSRVQLLNNLLNPVKYMKTDPVMRKAAAGEAIRLAVGMGLIFGTAKLAGLKVTVNPDDPDFGKVVWGSVHYDLTAGEGALIRAVYRFVKSSWMQSQGEELSKSQEPLKILWDFTRKKLAPWPGAGVNFLSGKDVVGHPANVRFNNPEHKSAGRYIQDLQDQNQIIRMVAPMLIGDFIDAANEEGWIGVAKTMPAFGGLGIQSYTPNESQTKSSGSKAFQSGAGKTGDRSGAGRTGDPFSRP